MPKCKVGTFLTCVIRGEKKVVALSDAPIPWPIKTLTIEEALKAMGRTKDAVLQRMWHLGISTAEVRRVWTAKEDALLRRVGVHEAAKVLGRSLSSTRSRWDKLGLSRPRA